jgi:predicted CopG family antitoxin
MVSSKKKRNWTMIKLKLDTHKELTEISGKESFDDMERKLIKYWKEGHQK